MYEYRINQTTDTIKRMDKHHERILFMQNIDNITTKENTSITCSRIWLMK